ncbi:hypothetical protein NOSIN_06830 [Nocardiopsis sinuspersici]|uniref:Nudix hydrolase domain-containing protein n=1 Tax=Nocardiopsis sinuspersici TaxID=501010 RepID=A0A1V3BYV1_9ACTN|nr:hypothetical protein NOSIN_06830 [Nocardiopsis sinuspersici]
MIHSQESPHRDWVHFFFVCRLWSGTPVNNEPHKHTEIRWWPVREPPPDTVDYCAQALGHLSAGVRFSRHRIRTTRPMVSAPAQNTPGPQRRSRPGPAQQEPG